MYDKIDIHGLKIAAPDGYPMDANGHAKCIDAPGPSIAISRSSDSVMTRMCGPPDSIPVLITNAGCDSLHVKDLSIDGDASFTLSDLWQKASH